MNEPRVNPDDRVQLNFSRNQNYDFVITTPRQLGFDSTITLTTLFDRLKEKKRIEHYEGKYPAVIDPFFLTSVSMPRRNFRGVEGGKVSLENRDKDLDEYQYGT